MATSIFFGGRLISKPGSYSVVDASGLESVGLGASGIVAVIGEAEGGKPASAMSEVSEFLRLTKPEQGRTTFRSGDLREVVDMVFAPAKDPDILAGAQEVVCMKVNPSTQSAATLANTYGDILALTSADYGAFTSQINVQIGSGTNQGKLVTVTFEDEVKVVDDLGGDIFFNLKYVKPTSGWDAMTAKVEAGGAVVCNATRNNAGLDSDITNQMPTTGKVRLVSAEAADTTQQVEIFGLDGSDAALRETVNLNGTTNVETTNDFKYVYGARVIGTTTGAVTVTDTGGTPVTIFILAAGANTTKGLALCAGMYAVGAITSVSSGASTKNLILIGKSNTGANQIEKITLTGTTAVAGSGNFSELNYIALGDVENGQTITFSAEAGRTVPATHDTLQKVSDYYSARYDSTVTGGFVFTMVTAKTTFNPAQLDVTDGAGGAVNCLDPANPAFYADVQTIINWFNSSSEYITAAKATGGVGGAPDNTANPVFLSGGDEGTTISSHWQGALNLLKKTRVNSVVVLSGSPAVHAMVDAHCAYMSGIGRSERDGFVGLLNTALDDVPTKTEAKSQIVDINSRHIRAFGQAIERYNTSGERQEFLPPFQAAIAAGMQAGSAVGTSLTFKYGNMLSIRQDSTWSPEDDTEEMIQAGLCFFENVEGAGRRMVRNITTHLTSNNLAYIEGSVNEAVNYSVYNFRTNMEMAVGKKGYAGTMNAAKGTAVNILTLLVAEGVMVTWRSLSFELITDVLETSVEIAPVIPVNFVKNTVHLVTVPQTTAA
jgi:hypothetical protein